MLKMSAVTFNLPWVLALLPLVLLLPRRRGWWLRAATLALLLVAIAGPVLVVEEGRLVVLVDTSSSVGGGALEHARTLTTDAGSTVSWFAVAGDTIRLDGPDSAISPVLPLGATDLARGLQVAAGSGATRVLLLSDGVESAGAALQALPPVPVDTFLVEQVSNARLEALLLPEQAAPDQLVEGLAVVVTDRPTSAVLRLYVSGTPLPVQTRELPEGRTAIPFTFSVPEGGSVLIDALIEVDFQQPLLDDRLATELPVSEQPPVLVVDDPATASLLRAAGMEVIEGDARDVQAPLSYSAVVIRGSANAFTAGQHEMLRAYVETGGGVLMTGGPESFGFGGWFRTPLEEALPVGTDLRTEVEIPLVGLVIVLDRSQSMAAGNPNRLELAKEGAIAVVDLAYHEDMLGLIAFSDTHEWIFPLRPATERGKREMLASILGLSTQGGTILGPAYLEALQALEASEAAIKHVIILSDGRLYDGLGPFSGTAANFGQLATQGRLAGVTTSTIAIGANADFEQLAAIAAAGGGRYYEALDVNTLPRIFTSEALVATRSLLREETFNPVARPHMLSSLDGPQPAIDAYVATSTRQGSEILLDGLQDEPVMAVVRYGLGRTAALTTDLNSWAPQLVADGEFASTLVRTVRWLQMRPGSFHATVTPDGGMLRVVVDAVAAGEYINNRNLVVRYAGSEQPLEQVAPGRYEGMIPALSGQGTLLVVDGADIVARQSISGMSAEFGEDGGAPLLRAISERTGGQFLTELTDYVPELGTGTRQAWQFPLLAALALFLAELVLRRFGRAGARPAGRVRGRVAPGVPPRTPRAA